MNIGAFIPIRLDSSRLPGKSLKKCAEHMVIDVLISNIRKCSLITNSKNIVICTADESINYKLKSVVEDLQCSIFFGNKNDLIGRFWDANNYFNFDIILQVDGDDPLCDPLYMDLAIKYLVNQNLYDVTVTKNLPFGTNVKAFTGQALHKVHNVYRTIDNSTGFGLYFLEKNICTIKEILPISSKHIDDKLRLTLDYEEDLTVISEIVKNIGIDNLGLENIIDFAKRSPEMVSLNYVRKEEYRKRSEQLINLEYYHQNQIKRIYL